MSLVLPKLDGIQLTTAAAVGLSQTYNNTRKFAVRTMDGTLKTQKNYTKIRTTISGQGWMLTGWEGLNLDSSLTLSCAEPVTIQSLSNVITIPAARRADEAPRGFAVVSGELVETAVNVVGNDATLTVVSGASHYIVGYYPEFSASVEIEQTGRQGWTLTAQEV